MSSAQPAPWLLAPVLTALLLFALAHRDVVFAGLCALAVLASYRHRLTTHWPARTRWRAAVGTMLGAWLVCVVYYWTILHGGNHLTYFQRTLDIYKPWMVTTSGMMLALAVVWAWHLAIEASRRTRLLVLCLGLLVITTGNLLSLPPLYLPTLGVFFATTLLALVAGTGGFRNYGGRPWQERLRRATTIAGGLVIIGIGTWIVSAALHLLEAGITSVMAEFMQGAQYDDVIGAGYSITIERHRSIALLNRIVATVDGPTPPGYLRTQVMSDYQAGRWKAERPAAESAGTLVTQPAGNLTHFNVAQAQSGALPEATQAGQAGPRDTHGAPLQPPASQRAFALFLDLRGAVPLPYATQRVTTATAVACSLVEGEVLHCTPSEGLRYAVASHPAAARVPYGTGAAFTAAVRPDVQRARQAPEPVLAALRVLAQLLVGDHVTHPLEAAQVLQDYFRRHYTYALTVDLAEQGDPIVDFVLNRRPAYCEYYASGLVLMLRALGIPARVVGGFVVREYNPFAGQWIVRQRDAHAWTEVFDSQSGQWVAFDATPPSVATPLPVGGVWRRGAQGWTWLELLTRTLVTRLQTGDLLAWLADLGSASVGLLRQPTGILTLGLGVVLLMGWKQRRRLVVVLTTLWRDALTRRRPTSLALHPSTAEARRLFERVARALEGQGLPIGPTETFEDYLGRVRPHSPRRSAGAVEEPVIVSAGVEVPWLRALTEFAQAYTVVRFVPQQWPAETATMAMPQADLTALSALAEQVVTTLARRQQQW